MLVRYDCAHALHMHVALYSVNVKISLGHLKLYNIIMYMFCLPLYERDRPFNLIFLIEQGKGRGWCCYKRH